MGFLSGTARFWRIYREERRKRLLVHYWKNQTTPKELAKDMAVTAIVVVIQLMAAAVFGISAWLWGWRVAAVILGIGVLYAIIYRVRKGHWPA